MGENERRATPEERAELETNPEINPRVYERIFGSMALDEYIRRIVNGEGAEQA